MKALLDELHSEVTALEASVTPSWAGLVEPLERIVDRNQRAWGVVSHLKAGSWVPDKGTVSNFMEALIRSLCEFGV